MICRYIIKEMRAEIFDRNFAGLRPWYQHLMVKALGDACATQDFRLCDLKLVSNTSELFWYQCRDLVHITAFRNPACAR